MAHDDVGDSAAGLEPKNVLTASTLTLRRPDALLVGEEVGAGPGVLFLHAGGECRRVWRPVAAALARNGYRCISYDLRGHGDSDCVGADELAHHAADVATMLTSEPNPLTVVGASLGGLATLLTLGEPGVKAQVSGVVLVDVVPQLDTAGVRTYLNGIRAGYGDRPLVTDVLTRHQKALASTAAELSDLPTSLLLGEESAVGDRERQMFSTDVPHAEVTVVANAGHLIARDQPTALARLLLTFMGSASARRHRVGSVLAATDVESLPHPGGTLRDHLQRTGDVLCEWGAPPWLVDAGYLHAAYGTAGFPDGLTGVTPAAIRGAVGIEAERMIDLYARCDRSRSYATLLTDRPLIIDRSTAAEYGLTRALARGFAELSAANELDVMRNCAPIADAHGLALAQLFDRLGPLLSTPARRAWSTAGSVLSRKKES